MHGEMEGSLAKTVRIGEMFSERIETSFPLLLMKRVDQMPDVWMEYLYVMPLVFWDACSCVSSLTAPQRTFLAPQKEIRALRKTCEMVRKDWRGKKYQKPDQRPDVHLVSFNNSCSTIQLTFSHHKSVSLPGLQIKKLAASVAIIFLQHIKEFPN